MRRIIIICLFFLLSLPNLCFASSGWDVSLVSATPLNVTAYERFAVQFTIENKTGATVDSIELISESSLLGISNRLISNKINDIADGEKRTVFMYGTLYEGLHEFSSVTINGGDTVHLKQTLLVNAVSTAEPEPPAASTGAVFVVRGVTFTPATPNLNQTFKVNVEFDNVGTAHAKNVEVTIDGGANFEVMDLTNKVTYADVWSGSRRTATFNIRAKDTRTSNTVTVRFAYNNFDQSGSSTETLNLPLGDVSPADKKAPLVKLGAFIVEPQGDGDFLLKFNVKNIGNDDAKNISLRLEGTEVYPRGTSNVLYIPRLLRGEEKEITIKMGAVATEGINTYSIPISYSYESDKGFEGSEKETLTVTAKQLGLSESKGPVVGTPRVFLSKYTLSHKQILAGNTVRLTLNIENSSKVEVGNIKISLGVIPVEGGASGTVFSPVDSSNSFFIEKISSGGTVVKNIDLYIDPNAAAKTYIVPVDIEYEDWEGKGYIVSEMVNLPVTQESKLHVLSVDVPPVGGVGQPVPISAEFVNVGKVALKNFMVNIEGEFPKENASYFLANMDIGMSDYFQGMVIPQAEGVLRGLVVFTYTDNANQEVRIEEPFEINVQQIDFGGPPDEYFPPDMHGENSFQTKMNGRIALLIAVLVIVAAGVWFAVKKRARRGEMFDEEL